MTGQPALQNPRAPRKRVRERITDLPPGCHQAGHDNDNGYVDRMPTAGTAADLDIWSYDYFNGVADTGEDGFGGEYENQSCHL